MGIGNPPIVIHCRQQQQNLSFVVRGIYMSVETEAQTTGTSTLGTGIKQKQRQVAHLLVVTQASDDWPHPFRMLDTSTWAKSNHTLCPMIKTKMRLCLCPTPSSLLLLMGFSEPQDRCGAIMSDSVAGKYLASTPQPDEAIHTASRFPSWGVRLLWGIDTESHLRSRQETVLQMLAQASGRLYFSEKPPCFLFHSYFKLLTLFDDVTLIPSVQLKSCHNHHVKDFSFSNHFQ